MEQFAREEILIGKENLKKLNDATVVVFGVGGVGSYVVEALARAGVKNLVLVDNDIVDETNINRQLVAYIDTIGQKKVDVAKARILNINPEANVKTYDIFFDSNSSTEMFENADYVVDAIDSVQSKIRIIEYAKSKNIPIISAMGTGNKLDPTQFKIADISKTEMCPLAKIIRKELKKREIKGVKVLYSTEKNINIEEEHATNTNKNKTLEEDRDRVDLNAVGSEKIENQNVIENVNKQAVIGTISYMPAIAGLLIASEVIKDIIEKDKN